MFFEVGPATRTFATAEYMELYPEERRVYGVGEVFLKTLSNPYSFFWFQALRLDKSTTCT